MRPIRLRMVAFGPFAEIEEINFSLLGDNPLFLINGPTGSGKSSILDAICFALYGETSGNEREARQMRCDHASPETLTEITLEFELYSGKYRITRIPEQNRPKARGDGFTEQKARAELVKIDGEKETLLVSPKITEATEAIINLTGLSAAQFRQVMILPQGKFRDLLLATSEDREAIFVKLFQTHVYSQLQQQLKEQSNLLSSNLKEIQLQKTALLSVHELETSEALTEKSNALNDLIKLLSEQRKTADKKFQESRDKRQKAEDLAKIFTEYSRLNEKLVLFKNKTQVIEGYKEKIRFATLAKQIISIYAYSHQQQALFDESIKKVTENKIRAEQADATLKSVEEEFVSLPEKENELRLTDTNITLLESYRQCSQQLVIAQTTLKNAIKAQDVSHKALNMQQKQLLDEKQKLEETDKERQEKALATVQLPQKEVELKKLNEQGELLRKISDLRQSSSKLADEIKNLEKKEEQAVVNFNAKNREKEVYEIAWQKGQAAILADGLLVGEPCVVCGSTDHPLIAKSENKLPSEKKLNDLRQISEKLKNESETVKQNRLLKEKERNNVQESIKQNTLNLESDDGSTLPDIRSQFKKCRDEIEALKKMALEIPLLLEKIQGKKNNILRLEEDGVKAQKNASEKQAETASAKTNVDIKQSELPEQFLVAEKLESAIQGKTKLKSTLQTNINTLKQKHTQARELKIGVHSALTAAESHQQSLEAQYKASILTWQDTLNQSEFANEKMFLDAQMETDAESKLTEIIRDFEDSRLLLEKNLEDKKQQIENLEQPDVKKLLDDEKLTSEEKNKIDAQYHQSTQRKKDLDSTQERIVKLVTQQHSLEKEYGIIGKLNDVSNGKNSHNLSLQRFVLSVLLDDVLTSASYRLNKMSKGRFQLYRKESVGDKRTKAGLDLEVEDAYTGKQRPAATLSGGESFMAALALALGLSDVVQSYAGGIRLDMLFIDEGFGSLDPESLELAISTLLDLRDSGRMVGIISHVEELKRMIDIRLDVIANREVSTTCLVGV